MSQIKEKLNGKRSVLTDRYSYNNKVENVLWIYCFSLTFTGIFSYFVYIIGEKEIFDSIVDFCLAFVGMGYLALVLFVIQRYVRGYQILKNSIVYRSLFRKREVKINDIEYVVLSIANSYGYNSCLITRLTRENNKLTFVPCAWISILRHEPENLLKEWDEMLSGGSGVDPVLSRDYNDNLIYSFLYTDKISDKLFKDYRGKIYITRSLYLRYRDRIDDAIRHYDIDTNNVILIKDKPLRKGLLKR